MDWPLFDQILDSALDVFVFHRCANAFFIIDLAIYRGFVIMLALLHVDVDFSKLFRA